MKTLEEAIAIIESLRERLDALERASGLFADDRDLDGPKGDAQVKFDIRTYRGPSCKGRRFSECPIDFLDVYAAALAYSADNPKEGKEKFAKWDRLDAARARGWARRKRFAGGTSDGVVPESLGDGRPASGPPATSPPTFSAPPALGGYSSQRQEAPPSGDDDIPF